MSVTNPKVIDFWGISKEAPNDLLLVMTDHLEWGDKAEQGEHLLVLQEKINSYIAFIESGEIYTEIPGAYGKYRSSGSLACMNCPRRPSTSWPASPKP